MQQYSAYNLQAATAGSPQFDYSHLPSLRDLGLPTSQQPQASSAKATSNVRRSASGDIAYANSNPSASVEYKQDDV